jgi:DtxR family transcriptional regulator, Mn-dependent transcriptional regulator
VLIEDALKHLYDAEYQHFKISVHSLAGALGITDNRAAGLLAHIEALGLLERNGIDIQLTLEGRRLEVFRAYGTLEREPAVL